MDIYHNNFIDTCNKYGNVAIEVVPLFISIMISSNALFHKYIDKHIISNGSSLKPNGFTPFAF